MMYLTLFSWRNVNPSRWVISKIFSNQFFAMTKEKEAGKGDTYREVNRRKYEESYERIFRNNPPEEVDNPPKKG